MTQKLPVYKIDLQYFFRYPIAKIEHNGFGYAIYDQNNFVMGFVTSLGIKVTKFRKEDGVFWAWAIADNRYRHTEDLKKNGQLVRSQLRHKAKSVKFRSTKSEVDS